MVRFLSPAWFELVADQQAPPAPERGGGDAPAPLVLQQVVTGTPDGEVCYQVVVGAGRTSIAPGRAAEPDVTFTSDWPTATAIAQGALSTQAALLDGRIRISGTMAPLAARAGELAALDPVPAPVRAATTY